MSRAVGMEAKAMNSKEFKEMGNLRFKTRNAIRKSWFIFGKTMELHARKEMLRKPKGGRTYFIETRGGVRKHVASAPGETHANLSGKLRRATSFKVHGSTRMDFGYNFGMKKSPEYDEEVEKGHDNVKPRPSIENTVNALRGKESQAFVASMKIEFKRF